MENTLENKARFFAQYWGQKAQNYRLGYGSKRNVAVKGTSLGYLKLKSLSDITDADAIEVSKIIENDEDHLTYHIVEPKDFDIHKTIKCVLVKYYSKYPGTDRLLNFSLVQIDVEEGDVIIGRFSDDGIELEDAPTDNASHVYDFLRLNGYAIPFNGVSVEQQIEYGWVKLI